MSGLINIQNRGLRRAIANQCCGYVGWGISAPGASTLHTINPVVYTIDGVYYNKGILSSQPLNPTHGPFGDLVTVGPAAYAQPAGTTVTYLLAADVLGNSFVIQGSYAGQPVIYPNDASRVNTGTGGVPFVPSILTTIGAIKVSTSSSGAFVPGTTPLDTAGLTVTYINVAVLPETL